MSRNSNNVIWEFFKRGNQSKLGQCNFCQKLISYKTTITNLKQHLRIKHPDVNKEFLSRVDTNRAASIGDARKTPSPIQRCQTQKTYTPNFLTRKLVANESPTEGEDDTDKDPDYRAISSSSSSSQYIDNLEEAAEDKPSNDVARHFERETGGRARCSLCHSSMPYQSINMTNHLKRWHDTNRTSEMKVETTDPIDPVDESSYNEVVYLDEPFLNISSTVFKHQNSKPSPAPPPQRHSLEETPKKQKRAHSPSTPAGPSSQQDEEIDKFGAYVIHLLKSTPPELCTKLQMDIVSLILNEKLKFAEKQKAECQNVMRTTSTAAVVRSGEMKYIIKNISADNFVLEQIDDVSNKEIASEVVVSSEGAAKEIIGKAKNT